MVRADVVTLVAETPEAHGVLEPPTLSTRKVYCTVKSIGQSEAYQAKGIGLNPEFKLVLSHSFEYRGEKLCVFRGVNYAIIRTYMDEKDGIELTLERVDGNAIPLPPEPEPTTEVTTDV